MVPFEQTSVPRNVPGFRTLKSRHATSERSHRMDKDRVKGMADQAKGKAKEWAGKATGDTKTHAEGKMDQMKGKVENAVGGAKDAMREKQNQD